MGLNFHSARHSDEQMTLGKSLGTNWWHIWKLFHIWEWKIRVPSPNATSNLRDSMVFWNSWGSRSILIQLKIWFNFKGKFRAHPLLTLKSIEFLLTLSRRRPLSYRNQSIHLLCKSIQNQSSKGFLKKGVIRNFIEFTKKYLCRNLFFW